MNTEKWSYPTLKEKRETQELIERLRLADMTTFKEDSKSVETTKRKVPTKECQSRD